MIFICFFFILLKVYAEASLVFPLLVGETFARNHKLPSNKVINGSTSADDEEKDVKKRD